VSPLTELDRPVPVNTVDERRSLPVRDLALGLRLLASLFQAGLPASRVLGVFPTLAPASWPPDAIRVIHDGVREGKSFASALATGPVEIPPLVIGMIRAGEAAGSLGDAIARAAAVMEQAAATRTAIHAALAYPLVLATAGSLSMALLVGVILPRFAEIVTDLGQELPRSARIVLATGDVVRRSALPTAVVGAIAALAWHRWIKDGGDSSRARWHDLLLRVPLAGPVRRSAGASRIASALSALLVTGVPLPNAMAHAARAAGDAELARRMVAARDCVIGGARLSAALTTTDAVTLAMIQLVRAGEVTGAVAPMLEHAARIEREWAEERVKALIRVIEPGLIIIFGAIVGFIAASLLQAVYSVRPVA
jgi:general secretion pathway protein F